ncbi:hypothetical protein CTAYLR_005197 [Chrysophaeum taylorii]|uniref:PI3K/PI4K catalytic domain-containing protein n=1 Tax=Chrysophaeum taylorii TaxID=2483200 RepID=A0AAD7UJN4_9STRA|nr:hypothetical protein CTAYLR_005180 [Chrysophaeum taylorii]KAJ8614173.1 hypothetical protein CTAYLR_005197 [Chrysophaeum taylorii]
MRLLGVLSGFLDVLARWLAVHRSLDDQQRMWGAAVSGQQVAWQSVEREVAEVSATLRDSQGVTDAEWEACLPQVTSLLLDLAPRVPWVRRHTAVAFDAENHEYFAYSAYAAGGGGESGPSEALTRQLRDALVERCSRSSQLGLQACWLLQDSLATRYSEFGVQLVRDCWRATANTGARESAALVASLVRVSEALAKVDRSKRRDRGRLVPLLEAMNAWLLPRAHRGGVRVPLCPLSGDKQLRILRLDIPSCEVMPSRARAPTILYCEAVEVAEVDDVYRREADADVAFNDHGAGDVDVGDVDAARAGSPKGRRVVNAVFAPAIWEQRQAALRTQSQYGHVPGWRLASFLVKADDELRREQLAMQFVRLVREILSDAGVGWLRPYAVVCAGTRAGLVETLADAKSLTHVKQHLATIDGTVSLARYFDLVYEDRRDEAALNFAKSLASYSLVCYLLDVKDRHNGNILLDRQGHVIHIDFGYMLGLSPGGINFESAPFKLTQEYVDVMGGVGSPAWHAFVSTFASGLHALRANLARLQTLLLLSFEGDRKVHDLTRSLALRFRGLLEQPDFSAAVTTSMALIQQALNSERTKQYDWYQWKTNGILM